MRKFVFENRKYGFELLMDLHTFENNSNVFFEPTPHTCDFFEIMIFEQASGTIELNGKVIDIVDNSFFFICPSQKKSCNIDLDNIKGFHLVFKDNFLSDFFDDKLFAYRLQYFYNYQNPQYFHVNNEEYKGIQFVLNEIITEINNYQNDSTHIIRSLLYFSLSKLNRLYSKFYTISPETQSNSKVHKFKELLESNIRKIHKVSTYCELLKTDRHQLNTMVKAHTGFTSKQIINNRLLQEIKTELRYSTKTIAEIAYILNFGEPNNLTRFFNKLEGISPTKFRENYQNDRT
ncbi:AraC family transcriptional regulator [uncultured Tenacibaculum sp.]|uniref:AraC family transcriptional regulator n=1 Tax=uncultured Tenacibaculum sp. TaxID=174713 RepID=UPI0026145124|nr:AraC family transcriptional regulator [uncultured Tenacibaculum sp.]